MQKVFCPICEQDNSEEIYNIGDLDKSLRNVICTLCGLVYIDPRPSEDEYLHYQGASGKGSGHHSRNMTIPMEERALDSNPKIKQKVAKYLAPHINKNSSVLDVGCGFGSLLNIVRDKTGAQCQGIEINKTDVKLARKFFGLNIFLGSLGQFYERFKELKKYDLIILHHTLEHLLNPIKELERIQALLSEDGFLYIGVPNILNIKKRPETFFQLGHAYSFSPHSINLILQKAGFKIIKFNHHAAFPGGLELLAMRAGNERLGLNNEVFSSGERWMEVKLYIRRKQKQYAWLRVLREVTFFWLPQRLRLRTSHIIYQALKNYAQK